MTDEAVALTVVPKVELGIIRGDTPSDLVSHATAAADALAKVIRDRKLFSRIQGKEFVRCEGWTTLAAMMGVTPHEVSVTEVEGTFTATVELRRITDGQVIGRASAECGMDESTWAGRARNARRSMALTRATGKACRLSFSWVMALAGYEVTPAEEMPSEREEASHRTPDPKPQPPPDFTKKPEALTKPDEPAPWEPGAVASETEREMVNTALRDAGIEKLRLFYRHTFNRPFEKLYKADVKPLIDAATNFKDLVGRAGPDHAGTKQPEAPQPVQGAPSPTPGRTDG